MTRRRRTVLHISVGMEMASLEKKAQEDALKRLYRSKKYKKLER